MKFALWLLNNGFPQGKRVFIDFHGREDHIQLIDVVRVEENLPVEIKQPMSFILLYVFASLIIGPPVLMKLLIRYFEIKEVHSLSFERFPFFYKLGEFVTIVEYQHGLSNVVRYKEKVLDGLTPTIRFVDSSSFYELKDSVDFGIYPRSYLNRYTIGDEFDYTKSFDDFKHFVWIEGGLDFGIRVDVLKSKSKEVLHRPGRRGAASFDWAALNNLNREEYCVLGFFTTGLTLAAKMGFHSFRVSDESNPYNQSIPNVMDV